MVKLAIVILSGMLATGVYAADTKGLVYPNERTVYAYKLDILKKWDDVYKSVVDKTNDSLPCSG